MISHARLPHISVEDYLDNEKTAEVKHEYVAGRVFAMVGASRAHNSIMLNLASLLRDHVESGPCQVFVADVKVRVDAVDAFYYPDVAVTCDPDDNDEYFLTRPCLIVEVLSPTTEATDRREKLLAYQTLPSLREYVLVDQREPHLEVFRREGRDWWRDTHAAGDRLTFGSVGLTLDVDAVYRGVL
ncbi:MAG: Uma2 family endonuclease [SAR324 cluster bacterium]|nr:Uma2 family endonuclease [SAR324 cluster bacterium]